MSSQKYKSFVYCITIWHRNEVLRFKQRSTVKEKLIEWYCMTPDLMIELRCLLPKNATIGKENKMTTTAKTMVRKYVKEELLYKIVPKVKEE